MNPVPDETALTAVHDGHRDLLKYGHHLIVAIYIGIPLIFTAVHGLAYSPNHPYHPEYMVSMLVGQDDMVD